MQQTSSPAEGVLQIQAADMIKQIGAKIQPPKKYLA